MVKASTPLEKSARMLDLVPYLISHQGISIQKLASEFGVSVQEITSDLNTLWMCGLPGYTPLELIDLEFESGYVSIRNADVLNITRTFTSRELLVILLGLDIVKGSIPGDRQDLLSELLNLKVKIERLIGDVAIAEPPVNAETRALILSAISQRKNLLIKYHNLTRDELTDRSISPYFVFDDSNHSYLSAFCFLTHSERTFRLDRILECQLVDGMNPVRSEISESDPIIATVSINRDLRINAEQLQIEAESGDSTFTVNALTAEWLTRSILAGAGGVEAVEPSHLRREIREAANRALQQYR